MQGRDAVLTETANSRSGETRDSGGITRSRSGETFSPERDYASLKTKKGSPRRVLVAVSTLVLSPRRDELAWAKIAEFTTVHPHAMAEPAQIYSQIHMQLHFFQ
ncbi:hypothetical protein DEO72_LG10g1335 [Vigna unguiculata]|uniref:Uncharacterized protein n=1 Tax=Vigna unguiculata TaxID=3917 RepID=A0A4D6NC41_VIGUN|nr:hypothetical protein DEO72_LG10g1335 [Vigna unguiculata]